ncbi:telomere length regulation protein TEL2 homolog isoform X2 [Phlebotomus argentipes]|uniref:telomere length regulation protein TEL2 homolog isoform X2 n=1 Tax=Phlebotomus argentipes TaxID=94469 RepID=UPI0028931208|nr:telomere length regulation protein TEL2 homolog isoform X2 [Phlebotomus argentipes]
MSGNSWLADKIKCENSLLLLNYLVRNGSERVVTSAREHIYDLRSLENYSFMDENGKDQGINVRHKVRELIDFIQDDDKVRDERKKAKKNKDKYIGMSSDAMGGRFGGYSDKYNDSRYDDRNWYSESSRGGNNYEDEYPYDGEKEDSDHESGYNSSARRYYDKERTSPSRTTPTGTASSSSVEVKKQSNPISVKSPTKQQPATKPSKKIDMGAAANFGKSSELGINSPTHKSSHDEDLFSPNNNTAAATKGGDLLEDLFRTCPPAQSKPTSVDSVSLGDEFNPRADDNQEFGDFASAFGGENAPKPAVVKKEDEFADFSSAFLGAEVPPAPVSANANNLLLTNAPLASNDFGGPSPTINMFGSAIPVQTQAPAQDLLSDFSGLQLNTTPLNVDGGKSHTAFEENMRKLSRRLNTVERIASEREEKEVTELLRRILNDIPYCGVIQELMSGERNLRVFADEYAELLKSLFAVVKDNASETVEEFFLIHTNCDFVTESMEILLNGESLKANANLAVRILERMMENEEIFWAAFIDMSISVSCEEENPLQKLDKQSSMQRFIQLVVSVPERLANCLQGCVPEVFTRQIWSQKLTVRVLLALYSVGRINDLEDRQVFSTIFLGKLFSRVIVDFNFDKTSMALIESVRFLGGIAGEKDSMRRTVNEFIGNLTRNATEIYAMILLENGWNINGILGDILLQSEHWRFALLTKIPLFTMTKSSCVVKNLVTFLADVSDGEEHRFLQDLLEKVLNSWSNKFSIENTSIEQHIYITKFIILSVLHMKRMEKYQLKEDSVFLNAIKKKLYEGIPHHLQAMDPNMRAIGMITAEMVLNEIENIDEETKLNFEVEKMQKIDVNLIGELRKLADLSSEDQFSTLDVAKVIMKIENGGENTVEIVKEVAPKQKVPEIAVKVPEKIDEDDLDSDDDLIAYDMSNDVPLKETQAPKYLLDLQDALGDSENADRFEQSLAVATDLIYRQLPDNEVQLGINLLQMLLNLEEKTYCENFEGNRFSACVAICCVIPKEAADHVCKEFYSKQSNYSISNRILMLEILGETAKELSKIQKTEKHLKLSENRHDDENIVRKFTVNEPDSLKEAREVIQKRILAKTRRFASKTQSPAELGSINRFAGVAGYFFWPLLHGFGRDQLIMEAQAKLKLDTDNVLLTAFIKTLSVLMVSAQNCPGIQRFAKELFALGAVLRFHADAGVRLAVFQMIGSILMTVSVEMLQREFQEYLLELINWLTERVGNNVVKKDPDEECKNLARHLLVFCTNVLKELN